MNNETKKKFTAFDVIIVLLIIAAIAFMGYKVISSPASAGENKHAVFTMIMPVTTQEIADLVKVGDTITVLGKGTGTVKDVKVAPAEKLGTNAVSGNQGPSVVPGRVDIYVTVEGEAVESADNITMNGAEVRIGATVSVEGKGYSINGPIISLDLFDKSGNEVFE